MRKTIYVKKASGEMEKFSREKIIRTLVRAGSTRENADQIVRGIEKQLYNGITTREIYKAAMGRLKKSDPVVASKYSLKDAIMRIGPSGYPFEKLFTEILKEYGYSARTHVFVQGHCTKHEIDIIAAKPISANPVLKQPPLRHYMIENKYHNAPGVFTGLKEVMYTYARFLDLQEGWKDGLCQKFDEPWLVTNTKFSGDAIEYSNCRRIRLTGWRYPSDNSLETLIEEKKLYPITVLTNLDRITQDKLAKAGIMLCKTLVKTNITKIKEKSGVPLNKLSKLREESEKLCTY